ncbi:MAG TPA: phosphotransferase [Thermomicrobiales bacterium]|nr:phosphotransferase [Thermomicrobiales bacterium]
MTSVVRVGDTVHRSTGPWTPAVHCLLRHLEEAGFAGAPRLCGLDVEGREILTFIDGEAGFFSPGRVVPTDLWSDRLLAEAAAMLRRFHDATAGFLLPHDIHWHVNWPAPAPAEVICHNDFAPYNCIYQHGHLVGIIDFDDASPGPRTWDLAYAAYTFVPLYADEGCLAVGMTGLPDRARRLRLLCDSYGLIGRDKFVEAIESRVRAVSAMIQARADAGDVRYQRKIDEGHLDGYATNAWYLRQHRSELQAAL